MWVANSGGVVYRRGGVGKGDGTLPFISNVWIMDFVAIMFFTQLVLHLCLFFLTHFDTKDYYHFNSKLLNCFEIF